jgi:transposase
MKNALREARHDANAYRRGESIGVHSPRQRWPEAERSRIVAESLEPGAKVSEVARRNGVNRGVLSTWRKEASRLMGEAGKPAFAPVIVEERATASSQAPSSKDVAKQGSSPTSPGSMIEIEIAGTRIRVAAGVDLNTLVTVLAAVRRAS